MIEIKNLTLSYGSHLAVEKFAARISKGSITAIIGPNGSGKSSLLQAIAGDIAPASGTITINGRDVSTFSQREFAGIRSFAQQSHSYWMAYKVEEILQMGHEKVSRERLDFLVESLAMESILKQSITTLSGGQLQRVEIARALMRQNPLLLLDEPFASQDLASISRITTLLKSEKERGTTSLVVLHERSENLDWCDAVIELAH